MATVHEMYCLGSVLGLFTFATMPREAALARLRLVAGLVLSAVRAVQAEQPALPRRQGGAGRWTMVVSG